MEQGRPRPGPFFLLNTDKWSRAFHQHFKLKDSFFRTKGSFSIRSNTFQPGKGASTLGLTTSIEEALTRHLQGLDADSCSSVSISLVIGAARLFALIRSVSMGGVSVLRSGSHWMRFVLRCCTNRGGGALRRLLRCRVHELVSKRNARSVRCEEGVAVPLRLTFIRLAMRRGLIIRWTSWKCVELLLEKCNFSDNLGLASTPFSDTFSSFPPAMDPGCVDACFSISFHTETLADEFTKKNCGICFFDFFHFIISAIWLC